MKKTLLWLGLLLAFFASPARADHTNCPSAPYQLLNGTVADAGQVMSNFNSLITCVNANAAGNGANTSIVSLSGLLSPPSGTGSLFFYGSVAAGTANAQTITSTYPGGYTLTSGTCIWFQPTVSNSGATTLNVNATGATTVQKGGVAGLVALTGGELTITSPALACYNGTVHVLVNPANDNEQPLPFATLASAATTTLDVANCANYKCEITGKVAITSFGSGATTGQLFYLVFANSLTLTYNATSLIVPGAANITTSPGDTALAVYAGSGNWTVLAYNYAVQPVLVPTAGARNLVITVTSNTALTVAADYAVLPDTTHTYSTYCSAPSTTINTGSAGAGGLDTGSFTASTWYYVYIISTGSSCSALMSASATSPTLPTGYYYFVRVGAVSSDANPYLYRTLQKGARAQYVVTTSTNTANIPALASGSIGNTGTPTYTGYAITGGGKWLPPTATVANLFITIPTGTGQVVIVPNTGNYGAYNSTTNPPYCFQNVSAGSFGTQCSVVLESSSVYLASSNASGLILVQGWQDAVAAQ